MLIYTIIFYVEKIVGQSEGLSPKLPNGKYAIVQSSDNFAEFSTLHIIQDTLI